MRRSTKARLALVLTAALSGACAAARPANRFIRNADAPATIELMERTPAMAGMPSAAERDAAIRKARDERGPAPAGVPTIETVNQDVQAALAAVRAKPSAAAHLRAGQAYSRAGVLDVAIDHFDRAIALDGRLAPAYDGRARIWRHWGLVAFALADAARAVYFAPRSAAVHNTRGTVLDAAGQCEAARAAYRRALDLDPDADYARRNLERLGATPCSRPAAPPPSTPRPRRP